MAIQFYVPALGTAYVLRQEWHFRLYREGRNLDMILATQGKQKVRGHWEYSEPEATNLQAIVWMKDKDKRLEYIDFSLPEGTVLTVARIYVRQGLDEFNSITFRIGKKSPLGKLFDGKRFWVRLQDANNIICDLIG